MPKPGIAKISCTLDVAPVRTTSPLNGIANVVAKMFMTVFMTALKALNCIECLNFRMGQISLLTSLYLLPSLLLDNFSLDSVSRINWFLK